MEKSFKSSAANYGLILGLILALITVFAYVFMLELFTKWWLLIVLLALIIGIGTAAAVKAKKILGGFISFKNAFTAYFIAILIGTLISTIVGIVIFNFVDPEAAKTIQEINIENSREMMESFGATEADIDKAMERAAETDQYSLLARLQQFVIGLVIYCVFGLIVALAVRRKDPNAIE